MSVADYQELIRIAKDRGILWPVRCVRREDITAVEKKLGLDFSEQMIHFYTECGDLTIERRDVLFLDPNDTDDANFNLLAVALEARNTGIPPYLLPFFNLCDEDGNIAYLDFSRMKDGEPLVTTAYFGTNGFVITGKTNDDFGAYLLHKLNEEPLPDSEEKYHLTEGNAKALLEYWPSTDEQSRQRKNVTAPVIFFTVLLVFFIGLLPYTLIRYFGNINAIAIRVFISLPMIALCLYMINFVRRDTVTRDNYLLKTKEIGHEKLIPQMTSASAEVFFLNEQDLKTYIVFTDDYALFTYQKVLRWRSIKSITLSDHYLMENKTGQRDASGADFAAIPAYKAYKFEYELEGNIKSELIIKLYPHDLEIKIFKSPLSYDNPVWGRDVQHGSSFRGHLV